MSTAPKHHAIIAIRLWFGILAAVLVAVGFLSGCKAMAWASMNVGDAIACLGAYQRTADLAYGPLPRNRLDIYRPTGRYLNENPDPESRKGGGNRNGRTAGQPPTSASSLPTSDFPPGRPVVIFFHGGDWSQGYPGKSVHRFVGDALTSRGFVAVIANYRRYPKVKFPAFVDDGARAVTWVHQNIAQYGGDPDRIFVMGHSAGAHIAAMLAVNGSYLRRFGGDPRWIKGMIGMAGPYSFLPIPPGHPLLKEVFGPPTHYPLSQPVNYVDADDPPLLLLRGGSDRRVPAACMDRMFERVDRMGGSAEAITYPNLSHIMLLVSLATPVRWDHWVLDDIAAFIHRVDAHPPQIAEHEDHGGESPSSAGPILGPGVGRSAGFASSGKDPRG